jgi:hypothetical protein
MAAELPPSSGYTYAVELSADEALNAGATTVDFSQPVAFYLENFINFPVSGVLPVGWYDRSRGLWVPSDNGRVVKILSVSAGMADLDTDGSGAAATASALSSLGVTATERQQLAVLYQPGQVLWRASVSHFSLWDMNAFPLPPDDAVKPNQPPPRRFTVTTISIRARRPARSSAARARRSARPSTSAGHRTDSCTVQQVKPRNWPPTPADC